jgi:hypothetical protein
VKFPDKKTSDSATNKLNEYSNKLTEGIYEVPLVFSLNADKVHYQSSVIEYGKSSCSFHEALF